MPLIFDADDGVFFRERDRYKAPGVTRSLDRARAFAAHLGLDLGTTLPVLAVVGSKGKGTTAVFASAVLAASGLRVGTLTSPGYRSNRERIRVDGAALGRDDFASLARVVSDALDNAAADLPDGGYLSPTGLFTLAAVRYFLDQRCDVMVLEAGMGGISDEISLFMPQAVAVTSIFAEHLGLLGDSIAGIAANKLGVIRPATAAVVALTQVHDDVTEQIQAAARGKRLTILPLTGDADLTDFDGVAWPPALVGANARLGAVAASEMLRELGGTLAPAADLALALESVELPGRLSTHIRGTQRWAVDAAINATGAAEALLWCHAAVGRPDTILTCIPDDKDGSGVAAALRGHNVVPVRVDADHLHFDGQPGLPLLTTLDLDSLGAAVLALGTISFVGEVLRCLDVATETAFAIPGRASVRV